MIPECAVIDEMHEGEIQIHITYAGHPPHEKGNIRFCFLRIPVSLPLCAFHARYLNAKEVM